MESQAFVAPLVPSHRRLASSRHSMPQSGYPPSSLTQSSAAASASYSLNPERKLKRDGVAHAAALIMNSIRCNQACHAFWMILGDHPKAAKHDHLKTGQRG